MKVAKKMYKPGGAKKKDGMHRPEGAGNFDNMDDYNIVKAVTTSEGTIQGTPTNAKDIVNKEYVDAQFPIKLNEVANPDGNKSFTMSNKLLAFRYTAPTPADEFEGAFEIEATGGFTGNLLHVHQHTGNPGEVHMVHLEAEDADVLPLCSIHANGRQLQLAHTSEVIFCNFTVDASDDLTIDPSSTGKVIIDSALDVQGNITTTGTVDGVDIAARDHAESHSVASHNDTTGTGAELNTLTFLMVYQSQYLRLHFQQYQQIIN